MPLFAAIPSIYLHQDAHYLAKRKVYIFNLMIPLCGSWAGLSEILIWGFLRRLVANIIPLIRPHVEGVACELCDYESPSKLNFRPRHLIGANEILLSRYAVSCS